MKKILPLFALFTTFLSAAPLLASAQDRPVEVVATFSILGDLAKQVGGDRVSVRTLVGPEEDAHVYKPTPDDSVALSKADLVIENGLGFEGWLQRLLGASGFKGRRVVASQGIASRASDEEMEAHDADHGHGHAHEQAARDPHAWQDVAVTRIYVRNIADALAEIRPDSAAFFRARAKAYDAELEKLDAWVKKEIGTIIAAQRKIITSHDAFGYFGAAYGVTFLAPQGISTEVTPAATQVARLLEQMKAEKIKTVFFENRASPKLVRQLAKDGGAALGAPVYADALSKTDGPAASYIAMIRHNVGVFKDAMNQNGK